MGEQFVGPVILTDVDGHQRVVLGVNPCTLVVGGDGRDGTLALAPASKAVTLADAAKNTILAKASDGSIVLGKLVADQLVKTIRVEGATANLWIGGNGVDGDLVLHPSHVSNDAPSQMSSIHLSANGEHIAIKSAGRETIKLDGAKGDIELLNADGAEEFAIDDASIEPGSVLVIENETRLRIANLPYDRCVAGVVSGADGIRPGIVLGRRREGGRVPVALFGKVACKVDATYGPINAGDLLTTSMTPGHAMRAEPSERAFGAVIGKALSALRDGRALVPVLVGLQ